MDNKWFVAWAGVAPQHTQFGASSSVTPSRPQALRVDWSYSEAMPWSEQPGK
jgi:hypothetical protein